MKYLLITPDYPNENDLYNCGFIHKRVQAYKNNNREVQVFVIKKDTHRFEYRHEDVNVIVGSYSDLLKYYQDNQDQIHKILIHFINKLIISFLKEINFAKKSIIWVHGFEALGWYRRLYDFQFKISFFKYIVSNIKNMIRLHFFVKNHQEAIHLIFVSNWMKEIMERDTISKVKNFSIIPNFIDTNFFSRSHNPSSNLRKKILLIRPFSSKKYANDIAMDAISILSKKDFFKELEFTIVGKGRLFEPLTSKFKTFKNISFINNFLNHSEIRDQHRKHGILLCPTRQDAQGVSMCEAMASGLVVMTSDNTAIPEYVSHNNTGLLSKSSQDIANNIEEVFNDKNLWDTISQNAAQSMIDKCSEDVVIRKELKVME